MTTIEVLLKQTKQAYSWVHKLKDTVPEEKWDAIAPGMDSSLSWQLGHQIISIYYHTIMTTVGHLPELLETIDLRSYTKLSGYDTRPESVAGKFSPDQLRKDLKLMEDKSLEVIASLTEEDLDKPVEPTKMPHPVAITKFDAIDWNIKHTMWHCGQMATWKRMVDKPHDYGIRKPE
ncbi:DinB superfamily protein [Robiginitalea myxolifaciens]|uniref:DinB superfamily protein n=1 Tax=Robiginitalea myxolifaciens TaxID=400055 RepID=A0A1I6FR83_9FLAO|nr:DinB family protein [Robiginitalea myxolifaciens]SFR32307.1 DinB superfamily protein [Robiginitalea myxolifaciens]